MQRLMHKLLWYLARKLGYSLVLKVNKHFYYTELHGNMPDEITVYFA